MLGSVTKERVDQLLNRFVEVEMRIRNLQRFVRLPSDVIQRQRNVRSVMKRFYQDNRTALTLQGRKILNRVLYDESFFTVPGLRSGLGLIWYVPFIIAGAGAGLFAWIKSEQNTSKELDIQEQILKDLEEKVLTPQDVQVIYGPVEQSLIDQIGGTVSGVGIMIMSIIALPWILKTVFKKR